MKNGKIVIIALMCVMLFGACENISEIPDMQSPLESDYGRISISLTGEKTAPRTIMPEIEFDKYVYTFTKEGEETGVEETPDEDGFFTLGVGSYTVAVQAFVGEEEPYTLAASGVSELFTVLPNNNDPVVVFLSAADIVGQGMFNYTITFPASVLAEVTLQKWPELGDSISLSPGNVTEGNGVTETVELEFGSYMLTVLVHKVDLDAGIRYAGISEAIHINTSQPTVYTKNFTDNDFLLDKHPSSTIAGVTVPISGRTPVTIIPETDQYTGTVEWEPEVNETFISYTDYTAAITLTPKTGYTLQGIPANFFIIEGATVANEANPSVIMAVFPKTGGYPISIKDITGVTSPVAKASPVTIVTATDQYTGTVEWEPEVSETFATYTDYTATITLTPKSGYILEHVPADFFTVAGATTASNPVNSGVITAAFPATGAAPVDFPGITGVTPPATGIEPVTTIMENAQYAGTVTWSPEVSGNFAAETVYTATITLTAKIGYTLDHVSADFFTVTGATTANNPVNSGIITAVFPQTDPAGAALMFYWVNEQDKLATTGLDTGTKLSKTGAESMTITADGDGYTNQRWYINGVEDTDNAGKATFTFQSSVREIRDYTLTLVVEKDSKYYNTNFAVTITE